MQLKRYFGLVGTIWKNSLVREMGFKSNFLLWIVVEFLWFALQLGFIAVIYQHTEQISSWTKWEVVLLIGSSQLVQQLFSAIFLSNCTQLSEHIRTGRLDFMLLLPVNTRFLVSFRQVDLGSFVNAFTAIAVVTFAARKLELAPSLAQVAGYLFLIGCGVLIHYSLVLSLASISFWTVRAQGIVWGYYSFLTIGRWPDAAFQGFFKAFFTLAVPMLLVTNVPAKHLIQRMGRPADVAVLVGLTVGFLALSEVVWRSSLKRYASASS